MNPFPLVAALALGSPTDTAPSLGTCTVSGVFTVTDVRGEAFEPEFAEVYVDTRLPISPRQQERTLRQKNKAFVPRVLVVEAEDTVIFKNEDDFPHEIHADRSRNAFVSGQNQRPETFRLQFSEVGESLLGCRIHPQMSGVVLTVPNAFHVAVGPGGKWSLGGLPAQDLELVFWARNGMKTNVERRRVKACTDTKVDVTVKGATPPLATSYGGQVRSD
ncbi:MAG: hypothetical protein U0228_11295 [Myxococcaceae bacterium]